MVGIDADGVSSAFMVTRVLGDAVISDGGVGVICDGASVRVQAWTSPVIGALDFAAAYAVGGAC